MSDIESLVAAKTSTTIVISYRETDTNERSRVIKPSSNRQEALCKNPWNRAKAIIVVALNFASKWKITFHRRKVKNERKKGGRYGNIFLQTFFEVAEGCLMNLEEGMCFVFLFLFFRGGLKNSSSGVHWYMYG